MFVSYRWLERHVDLKGIRPETLADDLTLSTCEVEGLEPFVPCLGDVVVGHVVTRDAHPDADKLSVCTVDLGGGEDALQIVCGAPNVAAGQKVAVATVGTTLPGDFKIKRSKIRGVESRGMICSERELGLGEDHQGIWVLDAEAEVGRPVGPALGIEDWIIEIDNKSLTHRPDLWGHRGLAGEVAAIYGRELAPLDLTLPPLGDEPPFPLRVESSDCPRYLGLAIDGVAPRRSPEWLRMLLLAAGQRPLDLLVDLSNFVMLDLGQPNHAFDRTRLAAEGIVVRNARPGETMATLDEVQRKLEPSDLLICSGDEPVALAGVMGGAGSKVEEGTDRLLLEVANFRPAVVRRTSARLGLRTDASARFEKHLDPTLPLKAAAHFARLLLELEPATCFPCRLADAGEWSDPAHTLPLRPERVRTALGAEVSDDEQAEILTRLGFGVERRGGAFEVAVPSARATKDVTIEQDLIEEVGRLHRYGNVPERTMLGELVPSDPDPRRRLVRQLQDRLAGSARFHEVISYSFLADALLETLELADAPHVEVTNPVAEGVCRVRRGVLPSLLGIVTGNRRLREEVRLFEVGKGYLPERANPRGEPAEVHQLALVWARPAAAEETPFDRELLPRLQGVVEDLIASVGLPVPRWEREGEPATWAHPVKALAGRTRKDGPAAVHLAGLEPGIARALGLEGELASEVAVAEISLDVLLDTPDAPASYQPIPRFPEVKVDVAMLADEELPAGELAQAIRRAGKGVVAGLELFDLYRGESLGAGRKSLAWHVVLRSDNRTLTDKDAAKFLGRLERGLDELGATLRKG